MPNQQKTYSLNTNQASRFSKPHIRYKFSGHSLISTLILLGLPSSIRHHIHKIRTQFHAFSFEFHPFCFSFIFTHGLLLTATLHSINILTVSSSDTFTTTCSPQSLNIRIYSVTFSQFSVGSIPRQSATSHLHTPHPCIHIVSDSTEAHPS